MTAFASVLPLDAASRIWDSLILDGLPGLIKATLALLKVFIPLGIKIFENALKIVKPRPHLLLFCCEKHLCAVE